jgi:penicillin-binding protein 1A
MPRSNNKKEARHSKPEEKTTKIKTQKGKIPKNKKRKQHPKLKLFLKILLIIFLLLCVAGAGVVSAMMFGLFGNDFEITKEELIVGNSNTIVLDKDGNEIANLSTDENRKTISLSEMSPYLPKAYIAIEDKRFYSHSGVDIKRTAGAILGAVTGNSSYGGSSITQQLVKNITKDKARSGLAGVVRKMKEWSKAVQVERMISKDQILELYLNIIFVGGNELHGVELGSQYYFNKSAKDLSLAQCAFLAGINNSPNSYSPYDTSLDQEKAGNLRKERTLTVLKEMKTQGMIENEDEYNAAVKEVEDGLKFEKGYSGTSSYSYHTAETVKQVIKQVMEEKNISEDLAKNYVYGSGLTIYSTEDQKVQARVEEEFAKTKYQIKGREKNKNGELKNDHTQAGMVIIDNQTNQVVAVGGSLGEQKTTGWNRGTQLTRQTGSSMKPLADIVPGLQEKVITAATIYDDAITDFGGGYKPKDYNIPKGYINIRSCIRTSQNIPMVKVMMELTPKKSIEYLKKMGITTLDDTKDANPALSIGGLSKGISPLEMAGAYASIANDGVYTKPIFFTKVVDSSGNTVLTANQEKTRVISEQNAYLTRSIVSEPTKSGGTATYCAIPGMETCAKTGSTDDYVDRWLCGFTPYYTAACWFGYDNDQEPLKVGKTVYSVDGRNPAGQLWSSIMKDIHKGLANKNFNKPSTGLVQKTICKDTGGVATSSCTNTYTETFTTDNVPENCQGHGTQKICTESGKVANEYCPADKVKTVSYGGVIPKEQLKLWNTINKSKSSNEKIDEVCTVHTKKIEEKTPNENKTPTNTVEKEQNKIGNTVEKPTTKPEENKVPDETGKDETAKDETAD